MSPQQLWLLPPSGGYGGALDEANHLGKSQGILLSDLGVPTYIIYHKLSSRLVTLLLAKVGEGCTSS